MSAVAGQTPNPFGYESSILEFEPSPSPGPVAPCFPVLHTRPCSSSSGVFDFHACNTVSSCSPTTSPHALTTKVEIQLPSALATVWSLLYTGVTLLFRICSPQSFLAVMQPRSSAVIASSVVSLLRIFARFAFRFSTSSFTAIAHALHFSARLSPMSSSQSGSDSNTSLGIGSARAGRTASERTTTQRSAVAATSDRARGRRDGADAGTRRDGGIASRKRAGPETSGRVRRAARRVAR
mmetsp:Transcript_15176/g.54620  ORF Transcript_15176/g.54620 Transcript_15176/m.54620 type:complete len:238 (+) Transcript_15176:270-983(+)